MFIIFSIQLYQMWNRSTEH